MDAESVDVRHRRRRHRRALATALRAAPARHVRSSSSSSAPRAGGVILSEEIDGFTIDGGPDALLVQKPEGIALCEELGLGDRLVPTKPPRLAFIQRGGRLHRAARRVGARHPDAVGPFRPDRTVLVARQAAHGRGAVRAAAARRRATNRSARS